MKKRDIIFKYSNEVLVAMFWGRYWIACLQNCFQKKLLRYPPGLTYPTLHIFTKSTQFYQAYDKN